MLPQNHHLLSLRILFRLLDLAHPLEGGCQISQGVGQLLAERVGSLADGGVGLFILILDGVVGVDVGVDLGDIVAPVVTTIAAAAIAVSTAISAIAVISTC